MCGLPHITTPQPTPALSPLPTHLGILPSPPLQGFLLSHQCVAKLGEQKEMQPLRILLQVHLFSSVTFLQLYGCASPTSTLPSHSEMHITTTSEGKTTNISKNFLFLAHPYSKINELTSHSSFLHPPPQISHPLVSCSGHNAKTRGLLPKGLFLWEQLHAEPTEFSQLPQLSEVSNKL